jgi:hypothetical protein
MTFRNTQRVRNSARGAYEEANPDFYLKKGASWPKPSKAFLEKEFEQIILNVKLILKRELLKLIKVITDERNTKGKMNGEISRVND